MNRILLILSLAVSIGATSIPNSYAEVTKQQAASIAKSHYQGRVIDVKNSNGSYRVKILDQKGGMHIVIIDKQSGNIKSAN